MRVAPVLLAVGALMSGGCGGPGLAPSVEGPARIVFRDVTAASGVDFVHDAGRSDRRLLPETMGSGVAVFDADGDGLPELAFADFGPVDGPGRGVAVWRNLGGLRFARIADALPSTLHAMGLAVADVDGDRNLDLLVTGIDGDELWLGRGDGRFWFSVTSIERFEPPPVGFSTSAAFLEGAEGLEAVIARYVEWSAAADRPCVESGRRRYCTPEGYPPVASRWLRVVDGQLADVTAGSAFAGALGKALGVVVLDADGDGRLDLALANDTVPNQLFARRAQGWVEEALPSGFAVGAAGVARGGMGIAAGDLGGDGHEDLVVGNFAREAAGIFRADGAGGFTDVAAEAGIGLATHLPLAFGVAVVDLDLDGALDLVVANGHIEPEIAVASGGVESFAQPLQVFHNDGAGHFVEVPEAVAGAWVGRGLASGDLDGDGDLDLVVSTNGGAPAILRNDTVGGRPLRVRIEGPVSNRAGLGAWLELELSDGRRLVRRLEPSGSYLSASEPVATFGLGTSEPRRLTVTLPDGATAMVESPPIDTVLVVPLRSDPGSRVPDPDSTAAPTPR